jgi:dihydroorotase-like cyclic amidohydrolase
MVGSIPDQPTSQVFGRWVPCRTTNASTQVSGVVGGLVVTAADEVEADQVIDATGKYVIPGGVDAHTHMGFGPGPYDYDDDGNVSRSRLSAAQRPTDTFHLIRQS